MKNITILVLSLLISMYVKGQVVIDSTRDSNNKMVLSSIIQSKESTLSKDKIYESVKMAIAKRFGNSKNASIYYESKEEGVINFKAQTKKLIYVNSTLIGKENRNGGHFNYDCKVLCKAGKSKIIISDITHEGGQYIMMRKGSDFGDSFPSKWGTLAKKQTIEQWPLIKEQAFEEFKSIIQDFLQSILSKEKEGEF
ncbi:DUF4468 domain-containing protein [Arcicella aquatica]|uniref:DUF4468 domain-containing protein n=1 Tax=Arcicella aquatica TaxID=217141 RepID=A0ABU5QIT0_9BACT|nr:DUF4468 domain-containing protein [Arcicella aquatica]MEA5256835.1 DUF4468 domain-containing protein [Arcicella aquatica]